MSIALAFFTIFYTVLMLGMLIGWLRLPETRIPESYHPQTFLSVLIPVRNEGLNIEALLQDLDAQHYPKNLFEVLVADDASEDDTAARVLDFSQQAGLKVKLIPAEKGRPPGKKSMLALGLQQTKGRLIVQTDGDCRVEPKWLSLLEYAYVTKKAKFISGPVKLVADRSVFGKMQVTEFASLIGTGAAAMGLGIPNMCNGANLAFEKAAFESVNGYAGNEQVASGDDEFLMHKIQKQFPGSVHFLKNPDAVVRTGVQETVGQFLRQRVRWASKWKFYQNLPAQVTGLLVLGTNLLLGLTLALWLFGQVRFAEFWPWYFLKCAVDFVFLGVVLRFLGQARFLLYFLPWQVVYSPYVIYCGFAGLRGTYTWKGRKISNP